MWSDDAASQDFLNFSALAAVIAESIRKNGDKPLSVGVSGAWGVGKSTTLELLSLELQKLETKPLVVRFHPWRHQNQDNVRAAFAECIAKTIIANTPTASTVAKKAQTILKRANLIRIAGYGLGGALTLATGIPFGSFFSNGANALAGVLDGNVTAADKENAKEFVDDAKRRFKDVFPDGNAQQSPYENIEHICKEFADTLEALNRHLVVLIDDLDRCLPSTTIEALEAMRLYFFVPRTVFVIAADEEMLRLAVRKHFEVADKTLDESHLQSYYDKLIQLPFRIPGLSIPDAVVYMTLLVLDQQERLKDSDRDEIRISLCKKLSKTWAGENISRAEIMEAVGQKPVNADFENRVALVERLAPIMVRSKKIGGNPRLIKRFMNSLSIRETLARVIHQSHETSEEVLAKILLLQRCGSNELVNELQRDVIQSESGKSAILGYLESTSPSETGESTSERTGTNKKSTSVRLPSEVQVSEHWSSEFARQWIQMEPLLGSVDLRPALYVSRGGEEILSLPVKLSESTRKLLDTLRKTPDLAGQFSKEISQIPDDEAATVMNALVTALRGASTTFADHLRCCVIFETAHPSQCSLLKSVLMSIDPVRFTADSTIILASRPWAGELLSHLRQKLGDLNPGVRALATELGS